MESSNSNCIFYKSQGYSGNSAEIPFWFWKQNFYTGSFFFKSQKLHRLKLKMSRNYPVTIRTFRQITKNILRLTGVSGVLLSILLTFYDELFYSSLRHTLLYRYAASCSHKYSFYNTALEDV